MARVKNHFHDEIADYCTECGSSCRCGPVSPEGFGLHYDSWTGNYLDQFNDVWVSRPLGRKLWIVAFRDYGNVTRIHSRHRGLEYAFAAAAVVIKERMARA